MTAARRWRDQPDPFERQVLHIWRRYRWSDGTDAQYLHWVRRFRRYCRDQGLDEQAQLTLRGVRQFAEVYVGPRLRRPSPRTVFAEADNALFAWAHALRALGRSIPEWAPARSPPQLPALVAEYVEFRRQHRGIAPATIKGEVATVTEFLASLRARRHTLRQASVVDLDRFVAELGQRNCRRTVRDTCSRLRAFLRFLLATGRIGRDLAAFVVAPRVRPMEKPPRALPWSDVRRLVGAVRPTNPTGRRDFAVLLLLTAYGMGAAEVVALRLEDIDWRGAILHLRRPKTGVPIELPLLPAVARALVAYLRQGRPPDCGIRQVFVRARLPHLPMSTSAVRHVVHAHARAAGIRGRVSAHALRHTHATRQIEAGMNPKVVGDILGHRRSSSTSVYTRVALERLRCVALPVPR